MERIKYENANATARPIIFLNFRNSKKIRISVFFENFIFCFPLLFRKFHFFARHSTSPPCGNQVDGLPPARHTETVAKPARLGPAKNGTTFENFGQVAPYGSDAEITFSTFYYIYLNLQYIIDKKSSTLITQLNFPKFYHFLRALVWLA